MLRQLDGFSDFVTKMIAEWNVPGLAMAIVKDDQIVFAEGFGRRDIEKDLPVTPKTIFPIASATKAFTAMSMGISVDEGKLEWDTPVRNYLPTFKLYDTLATERMTPRDLLTHRSGLPRHDLVWYNTAFTRQEIFDRLQYLVPSKDFRTFFQYQNIMYMTAGYLVGQLSGSTWEEFVRERILNPLEMTGTNFSIAQTQKAADYALPYREKDDEIKKVPFHNIDAAGPAGSVNSTVNDLAQWILLHLGKGKYKERQIVSEGSLTQMHIPQMVIQETVPALAAFAKFDEVGYASYGLGWFVQPYRGHNLIHHGGNIDGFSSLVSFMPKENIGIAVLTNRSGNPLSTIVSYNAYDRLLGLTELPWSKRIKEEVAKRKEATDSAKEKSAAERKSGTNPSHALADYTGDYHHPGYGVISVAVKDGNLAATYGTLDFTVEHYHYDVFEMTYKQFDMSIKASFFTDVKGKISRLAVPLEPAVDDIVFSKMPDKKITEQTFLERFIGVYDLFGKDLTVAWKGEGRLVFSVPGQPQYELIPYEGTEFILKSVPGARIEFKQDETGAISEAILTQPGAVFTARRK